MHDGKRDSRVGQQICKGSSNQKGYRKNYDDIMALPTLQGSYSYEKKKRKLITDNNQSKFKVI